MGFFLSYLFHVRFFSSSRSLIALKTHRFYIYIFFSFGSIYTLSSISHSVKWYRRALRELIYVPMRICRRVLGYFDWVFESISSLTSTSTVFFYASVRVTPTPISMRKICSAPHWTSSWLGQRQQQPPSAGLCSTWPRSPTFRVGPLMAPPSHSPKPDKWNRKLRKWVVSRLTT